MKTFIPQLKILPPVQLALWYEVTAIPTDFVLNVVYELLKEGAL
jgi:hypothetical protein